MPREVGADSVAPTPMRGARTRQQRREAEAAALLGHHAQSGTAVARVRNDHFQPLLSGRQFDNEYDEHEEGSQVASIWQPTAAHHVDGQSAAGPSTIDVEKLARAFTQYASISSHGVTGNVPDKKALAVAKSEKPKWDTQKEPFDITLHIVSALEECVIIWAESFKIEHLLIGPPLGNVSDFECHDAARRIILLSPSAAGTEYGINQNRRP